LLEPGPDIAGEERGKHRSASARAGQAAISEAGAAAKCAQARR
jgi:hypothetical protein